MIRRLERSVIPNSDIKGLVTRSDDSIVEHWKKGSLGLRVEKNGDC